MQAIRMLLVLLAVVSGAFAASGVVHAHHLRSGPPPAPAPVASPGPAPELLTPEEAVEEAHHTTAVTHGEYIVDKAGRELDKAHVTSAKVAKFVAEAFGDKDAVKEAKEKVVKQQAQVKKSAEETRESKDAFKAAKSAYQHAEVAGDSTQTSHAKKTNSKEVVVSDPNAPHDKKHAKPVSVGADSFAQVESKVAKKVDGLYGFDADQVDDDADQVDDAQVDDDGFHADLVDPFNQIDDDQVDAGEPKKGDGFFVENPNNDAESPDDDASMVSDDDGDDDDSFLQVASKKVAKKGDGFDGFGTPDPFNQNDDDQLDAGEPNAPAAENPSDDANMVSDDDDSGDDSFLQVASERFLAKMNHIREQFLAKAVGPH